MSLAARQSARDTNTDMIRGRLPGNGARASNRCGVGRGCGEGEGGGVSMTEKHIKAALPSDLIAGGWRR